jgi:hypothetical protein
VIFCHLQVLHPSHDRVDEDADCDEAKEACRCRLGSGNIDALQNVLDACDSLVTKSPHCEPRRDLDLFANQPCPNADCGNAPNMRSI